MQDDVKTTHPDITPDRVADWCLMRDTMQGQRSVKRAGVRYLPMPSGFKSMPDGGVEAYEKAYKLRAIVPELLAPSVAAMIGIIHAKETQITIPDGLSSIWENADGEGMSLEAFHRRITRYLLWLGRYGVLTTAPTDGGEPFLAGYAGDSIINWDRDFFVMDETGKKRSGFEWKDNPKFRVLELIDGLYVSTVYEGESLDTITATQPVALGGQRLDFVPFYVGNARDVVPAVETPPLIGIANAIINAYQLSADWRWQLFMSGQETLVAINGEAPKTVGAGVVHQMMGNDTVTPDLKYVSPSCSGIEAHEAAIEKQVEAAVMAGARMFEQEKSTQESGEARRLRFASETANLQSISQVSAALLERGLKAAARMKGLDDSDIVVTPPKDLLDSTMSAADFAQLFTVYTQGGMSWETFYERGQAGGIFSPERDADEEYALIDPEGTEDERRAALV